MKYINRNIENIINESARTFPAVLITGARQVGKTTLIRHIKSNLPYLTLDDPVLLQSALEEPGIFLKSTPPPLIIDEIQYAPNLFSYIKMDIDKSGKKGQFFLTGSQQFKMMKNISESLAGRIAIINLPGLSLREISGDYFNDEFIPTEEYLKKRKKTAVNLDYKKIWRLIHRGLMPAMHTNKINWQIFYAAYTKTYLERDVRALAQVGNESKFIKFMTVIASRTSQMLNLSSIAGEIGISLPTADRWLSILVSSNIVYLLKPYHNNLTKRAVKTPKLYFLDTGLAAYLTKWNTPEVLEAGAMSGAFFETFAVSEILKSYYNAGILEPQIYYYRDKDVREIDILIEKNGILHPVEIKKTSNPKREHIENFSILEKIKGISTGPGGIICMYEGSIPINSKNVIIPITLL